jgi:hypothetical protein
MDFAWIEWSNPVARWWLFLAGVSLLNLLIWIWTFVQAQGDRERKSLSVYARAVLWLSFIYVIVCAFRSVLPRADVQKIVLFDTWFSSVLVGRSVATVAEVSFVAQWSIVLYYVSKAAEVRLAQRISKVTVPLILFAECCSWYAVITTNYLGNTCEESTWGITYTLITIALFSLAPHFKGRAKRIIAAGAVCSLLYVGFMATHDVPMYFTRWRADVAAAKNFLGFSDGIHELNTRWVLTHKIEDWVEEIPWMSLYFSIAVWASLALCRIPLSRKRLSKHLRSP